jgi:hypothetical protein
MRCWSRGLGRGASGVLALLFVGSTCLSASAQDGAARRVELHFTPTARAQLAIWIESADGTRWATVRLTQSVSYRGVGNRPGATQMNSGWRWPFGRREGILPVWGHRRIALGGEPFPRVIFNGRVSEGNASSAGSFGEPRNTRDDYFCLSFNRALSGRDALDAVTCPTTFMSNKGRYVSDADVSVGYGEPWQNADGSGEMRRLSIGSLYPARRDAVACTSSGCGDHPDVAQFDADARRIMPELDAVTMATPAGGRAQRIVFDVPADWPNGDYVAYVEINVEGDYNSSYDDTTNPTPISPSGLWDYWAINYGYAYRGQPSVVYRAPFVLGPTGGEWSTTEPAGYGALHGEDGELRTMDGTISDNPTGAPGSGADRLRVDGSGRRLRVTVPPWDVCEQPNPPAECGRECNPGEATCGPSLICGPDATCVGLCDVPLAPGAILDIEVLNHPEERFSHQVGRLRFRVPVSPRLLASYELRVGPHPIVDAESFARALPAVEPTLERDELTVPTDGQAGDWVEVDFGGLTPESTYYVGIRALDECNAPGPLATGELTTTAIHFTTVSPCFVATAAYGSPLEDRVGVLRRFRDRHLQTNELGRALVRAYYAVGPHAAEAIRGHDTLRAAARAVLAPLVALAEWLD